MSLVAAFKGMMMPGSGGPMLPVTNNGFRPGFGAPRGKDSPSSVSAASASAGGGQWVLVRNNSLGGRPSPSSVTAPLSNGATSPLHGASSMAPPVNGVTAAATVSLDTVRSIAPGGLARFYPTSGAQGGGDKLGLGSTALGGVRGGSERGALALYQSAEEANEAGRMLASRGLAAERISEREAQGILQAITAAACG